MVSDDTGEVLKNSSGDRVSSAAAVVCQVWHIGYAADGTIEFTDENGNKQKLAPETPVSMNMWGFTTDYFDYSEKAFVEFLKENIDKPKAEYFIPSVVNQIPPCGRADEIARQPSPQTCCGRRNHRR